MDGEFSSWLFYQQKQMDMQDMASKVPFLGGTIHDTFKNLFDKGMQHFYRMKCFYWTAVGIYGQQLQVEWKDMWRSWKSLHVYRLY